MRCSSAFAHFSLALSSAAQGAERPVAFSTRTTTPPVIDGKLDDTAWKSARPIGEFVQVEPELGVPCSERTDIRFLHDSEQLYMYVRCFDGDPAGIVTTSRQRDALLEVDDRVEIVFDTFHDRRNAFFFQINAGGSKGDALLTNNGANFNKPWDGIWDGHATIDEHGWSAELALPFKTLNFKEGETVWGFNVERYIGRKRENARWACASRDYRLFNIYQSGELRGLDGMQQGIGLDVVPFFASHWQNDREDGDKTLLGEPGFDLFYKLIPSLTFSLTVNTDFAETEVDSRQINLTRFPLFFPERRDFFLQDSGVFEFGLNNGGGGGDRALIPFFSRRIGLDGNGEEVPILAGAKLTGRAGDYGIGVLDVVTDDVDGLDGQNLFATRLTKNVGEQSTIGLIATEGNPTGGPDNTVVGLDATWRTSKFRGDKLFITNAFLLNADSEDRSGDEAAFGLAVSAPSDSWSWNLGALEIQENFVPALGFVPRTDIRRYNGGIAFEPRPGWDGVRQLEFSLDGVVFTDTGGELETWETEAQPLGIFFESGERVGLELVRTHDELEADFEISEGVVIPVGEYEFSRARLELVTAENRNVSFEGALEGGDFFDGERERYSVGLRWQPSPGFVTVAGYELNDISLAGGSFDTQLASWRADLAFSPELSWNNFVQWDTESDTIGLQTRLRWIPVPHQEVFLVFNENVEADSSATHAIFQELSFKITYALRF
ncbi:MAG: carbohydrate binding family 9 domain-containing protein [Planctomycetota bacterium]